VSDAKKQTKINKQTT